VYSVLRLFANEHQENLFEQVIEIFHQSDATLEISKHRRENSVAMDISFNENAEQHVTEIVDFLTQFQSSIATCSKLGYEIQCDLSINSVVESYSSITFTQPLLNILSANKVELVVTVYEATNAD
jgi:hypothetical protein